MARLVITHSTYLDNLIDILEHLKESSEIKTITPGRISRSRSKVEKISIKVSAKTITGYRLLARKGKSVQEIFITTNLEKNVLQELIEKAIKKKT